MDKLPSHSTCEIFSYTIKNQFPTFIDTAINRSHEVTNKIAKQRVSRNIMFTAILTILLLLFS